MISPDVDCQEALRPSPPPVSLEFQRDLVALIPFLRAFSRSLCGNRELAEDMAQEALARAWRYRDRFEYGTNLKAWLFTILRNEIYTQARRAWREVRWDEALGDRIPAPAFQQHWTMELSDCTRALGALPKPQRDAVILVGAGGMTYEETAKMTGSKVGTVKSRVARGRTSLSGNLNNTGGLMSPRLPMPDGSVVEHVLAQLSALTAVAGIAVK